IFAVDGGDHIARLQAAFAARGIWLDGFNKHAGGGGVPFFLEPRADVGGLNVDDADTHVAAGDFAVLDQRMHDVLGVVGGNGESDPVVAAGARCDGRVDADDFALEIDQRSAGVAGIDGGIGLQKVFVCHAGKLWIIGADDIGVGAPLGRDD